MPRAEPAARASGPVVLEFGEDALLVDLNEPAGVVAARRSRLLAGAISEQARAGHPLLARVGTPVPAATSVLVPVPLGVDAEAVAAELLQMAGSLPSHPEPPADAREHLVPVRYGAADGPDLEAVAAESGVSAQDVVQLHAASTYEVLFLGFAPGFGYLGDLPGRIRVPRLATPRVHVPAGSVAIAGSMTAVYPQAGPGGWRLIGRTDLALFDPLATEPVRLRAGDRVRFVPA